jgi:hypothetical protein
MNAQTVFFCSHEELTKAIDEAVAPFTQQLIDTFRRVEPLPSVLSIAWIADDCSCGRETVRQWIVKGRKIPGWTTIVRLKVIGGLTNSRHLVRVEDYEYFLERLPTIRAQSKSMSLAGRI